jgi:hypothetical protein
MFIAPETPAALEAMQAGRYVEAAQLFERAAIAAHQAGDLLSKKMSATLSVKAYSKGGDAANAVRFASATFDVLLAAGLAVDATSFAKKVLADIRLYDQNVAADELSAYVGKVLGAKWHDPAAPQLPGFCSSCGGVVKPAEVVRPTPSTVACRFCGASLAR